MPEGWKLAASSGHSRYKGLPSGGAAVPKFLPRATHACRAMIRDAGSFPMGLPQRLSPGRASVQGGPASDFRRAVTENSSCNLPIVEYWRTHKQAPIGQTVTKRLINVVQPGTVEIHAKCAHDSPCERAAAKNGIDSNTACLGK